MASIANSINNLPLCLGNKVETLENLDLITPNRFLLGRNNDYPSDNARNTSRIFIYCCIWRIRRGHSIM